MTITLNKLPCSGDFFVEAGGGAEGRVGPEGGAGPEGGGGPEGLVGGGPAGLAGGAGLEGGGAGRAGARRARRAMAMRIWHVPRDNKSNQSDLNNSLHVKYVYNLQHKFDQYTRTLQERYFFNISYSR